MDIILGSIHRHHSRFNHQHHNWDSLCDQLRRGFSGSPLATFVSQLWSFWNLKSQSSWSAIANKVRQFLIWSNGQDRATCFRVSDEAHNSWRFHAVPLHPLEHIYSQQRWWACYMTSKLWSTETSHWPKWQIIPAWALLVLDHLFCCSPFCVRSVPLGSCGSCGEHDDFIHNISHLYLWRANYKASALPVKVEDAKCALTVKFYGGNYPDEHDSHLPLKVEARFVPSL